MTSPVPRPAPQRALHAARASVLGRLADPLLVATGLSLAVALLHVRDPHQSGSYGYCPWLLLTGTYCPGCGGLRAVNDLTDGDVGAALSSNLLVVSLIPVAVLAWAVWAHARWRGRPLRATSGTKAAAWVLAVVVAVFTLLRNLGVGAWLAP
jgi:predicted membrane chloride channel (bestrophin family)